MKRLFIFLCLISSIQILLAQDIYDKLAKKLCKCMEKEQIKTSDEMPVCFETILLDNISAILKYHDAKSMREVKGEEVSNNLMAKLMKDCAYMKALQEESEKFTAVDKTEMPKYEADSILDCKGIQMGEYYYLTLNAQGELRDTTFVTFTENEYFERMKGGRTYSRLKLRWDTDCIFSLKFVESNDPVKNSISKPGDTYEYELIKNNDYSMVAKMYWLEKEYQVEFIKIK